MKDTLGRIGWARFGLVVGVGVALVGGCGNTDAATLELFVTDLLRNAAAALLL